MQPLKQAGDEAINTVGKSESLPAHRGFLVPHPHVVSSRTSLLSEELVKVRGSTLAARPKLVPKRKSQLSFEIYDNVCTHMCEPQIHVDL